MGTKKHETKETEGVIIFIRERIPGTAVPGTTKAPPLVVLNHES